MKLKNPLHLIPSILCLAAGPAAATTLIDFETYALDSDLATNGWSLSGTDSSAVTVVSTTTSGAYIGGRAIQTDAGGSTVAGILVTQSGITGLQVDMLWDYADRVDPPSTPTLQLVGWDDSGSDGIFASGEREAGFAMDNTTPDFEFLSGGSELDGDTSTTFSADIWYRLTMTWSAPDGAGDRMVTLNGYDLTNNASLGVVNSMTMTAAQFGPDPSEWDGVAVRMTRGTFDNIQVIPEPSVGFLSLMAGGLVLLRRQRK